MQTDKQAFLRVFYSSPIDSKDEIEEKLDKARVVLQRLVGAASEREAHDALQTAVCRDKGTHDDISLGLLANILTDTTSAPKCHRDLTFISRDNMGVVVDTLVAIAADKYHKLTDISRPQLIWIAKELVRGGMTGADILCWNLMRQIAGGDISNRNLWLAENMLELYVENRPWLEKYPVLVASVIFTFLRILEDHFPTNLSNLKQKEVNFIVSLIRDNFATVCMNPGLGMGRDFVRLLQGVSRIPEIQALWVDLFYNPRSLSPHLTGVAQLLNVRTSRKFLQSRLTPEMEKKIAFLTSAVKFGMHKRYQEWFQRQFLATPESQTLRADIIRFIVGVIHPPNEILCSDILPRWAVIGWLLTTCTNPVAAANAKLALFFDWLLFDPLKDNIMNIEPGILVMYHSIRPHLAITATLLDFVIRLTGEFWPGSADKIKDGVGAAFRTILEKKVLQSLDPVLENPKLEPELRNSIQNVLMPLIKRDSINVPAVVSGGNGHGGDGHDTMNLNYSTYSTSTADTNTLLITPTNHIKPDTPSSQVFVAEPEFSDDEEGDDAEGDDADEETKALQLKPMLTGAVALRGSPIPATSVEEAERSKIFDLVQMLPPNVRMPLDRMLNDTCSDKDKSENLEEILEEFQLDKDQREMLVKTLIFIYKFELNSLCVDEESDSLSNTLCSSPIADILESLLSLKPADRGAKAKNLYRILMEFLIKVPRTGYKILLILGQMAENPEDPTRKESFYLTIYKTLATLFRNLKMENALTQDIKCCWELEPIAVGYLCPIVYDWFGHEVMGSTTILRYVVSTIDSSQLQDIVWRIAQGDFTMIDTTDMLSTITKSLDWETWEQHCVWTILDAHQFEIDDYLPVIPMLDYKNNAEALTALFLKLKDEKPTDKIMGPCLCRKPNQKDRFVMSLLICWSENEKDATAEVLTQLLIKACGSPVKRKRGGASGGRGGTSSPAGPVTPNVENVLAHLDLLRSQIQDSGIFGTDYIQAALLQVQSWVTETQRNKYKDLLGMCALEEEIETKERSKRSATGRKLPSSPTGSGGGSNTTVSESSSTSRGNLSRTRSGRTRQTVNKDEESDSSSADEDEEVIPRSRTPKKRRKTSALNSDSD